MWTLSLPVRVPISKNKFFYLNLNPYRNAHHHTLDRAKKNFDQAVKHLLHGIPRLERCTLEYVLFTGTRQICDTNNICTIVDKFFSDTLVTHGVIEDDNYNIVIDTRFRFGRIDKGNPRVEVTIRSPDHIPLVPPEVVKEIIDMKIARKTSTIVTITDEDLKTAIREYVSKHVSVPENATVAITELENYNYEVRLESDEPPTQLPLEVKEKPHRVKVPKLDPTTAMASLKGSQTPTPADYRSEPHQVSEPETQVPFDVEEKSPPQEASTTTPAVVTSFTEVVKALEPKQEETPPPAQAKPSLFSGLRQPKNS